jgi:hypothetical protein
MWPPELNPVERVFDELSRAVEGQVYASLDGKVDAERAKLAADPDRVRSLTSWNWIIRSIDSLPQPIAA